MLYLPSLRIWLRRACQLVLCLLGRVPVHVAFVMDGNRRYAERQHVDKATGHTHGYGKMVDVIHWCVELGVKYITVYAFSIDNFKRSPDEVTALMRLAEHKYAELAQDNGLAEREGIQMHIVGDLQLLPGAVQGAAARLMRGTAALRSRRATLNVCFSYTASEESVTAVHELQDAVRSGKLQPDDVTPEALTGALRTGAACPPVDLLVRTSGETRLSDFLLWQSAHAHLCYLPTLWPDLSYWDFARCVLSYQRHARTLADLRRRAAVRLAAAAGVAAGRCGRDGEEQDGEEGCPQQQQQQQKEQEGAGGAEGSAAGLQQRSCGACATAPAEARASAAASRGVAPSAPVVAETASSATSAAQGADGEEAARAQDDLPGHRAASLDATDGGCGRAGSAGGRGDDGPQRGPPGMSLPLADWYLGSWFRRLVIGGLWLLGWRGDGVGVVSATGASSGSGSGRGRSGGGGGGGGAAGREVRLLRFFERLEQARLAWIAAHADL
ncbi:hypothetical protein PLESTF_000566600 [Pleodorina starrii]|nr:hypothetical protein PLESTF_000566600 [Pleodorina starrii]